MSVLEQVKAEDRILVVAPHPDDESIGCGGLLCKYGPQCDVLLITDGRKGYDSSEKTDEDLLVQIRYEELLQAAKIANIHNVIALGLHDGTAAHFAERILQFDITPYQFIFVPNRRERHKDHSIVLKLFRQMKKKQNSSANLFEYEVWSPLAAPTDVLDISDVMPQKLKMVCQHASQTRFVDYEGMTEALNRYRGAGFHTQYAEAYSLVQEVSWIRKLYHYVLPDSVRKKLKILKRLRGSK